MVTQQHRAGSELAPSAVSSPLPKVSQHITCLLPLPVCGMVLAKTPSLLGFSIYQLKLNINDSEDAGWQAWCP